MSKIYPYAGFWKRALAFLIDGIILSIPSFLFSGLLVGTQLMSAFKMASAQVEPTPEMMLPMIGKWMAGMAALWVLNIVILWLYYACFESGKYQATPGKMALGIKVVGANGQRISFARATGRTFAKFISHMILYFGDYMAGFTQKRQALHDIMATTYVVDKNYQPGNDLPALPFSKGGCAAGIVAAVAPVILYIGSIVLMIAMAWSDLKDDPDMQKIWENGGSDESVSEIMRDNHRELQLITADLELTNLAENHKTLAEPVVKEGITYSQSLEGYRATLTANGQTYELLLRPGSWQACCAKGPNGSCGNDQLYKPCEK